MKTFQVVVPYVDDMGSISPYVVRENRHETKARAALWFINAMRDHDGLPHLTRMPKGTRYKRVQVVVPCTD